MQIIADLQLHSKYAQAVSKYMELPTIALWAQKKGIHLVTTGDWTNPLWFQEIREQLEEKSDGVYQLKPQYKPNPQIDVNFLLVTEVSCRFYQDNKYHGIHILIFAPNLEVVEKINKEFVKLGYEKNLREDGRPMLPISCDKLAEIILGVDERCLIIPAHSWTPWFGFYGSHGGFNSLDEAFGKYSKYIYAIETGLGSDPAMNWRIKELDNRNIVSFSDAHSMTKLGREATVFEVDDKTLTYELIRNAIITPPNQEFSIKSKILHTIEFYRQEGKYYATGHRKCGVCFLPEETPKDYKCPVCGKKLTVGAAQRTEDLAERKENPVYVFDDQSVRWVHSVDQPWRPPFVNIVPLQEVLSEVFKVGVGSKKVQTQYEKLVAEVAPEFELLLKTRLQKIEAFGGLQLRDAIEKNRRGDVIVKPGYDGIFGVVKIDLEGKAEKQSQQELF